jgi:hypothetical protein
MLKTLIILLYFLNISKINIVSTIKYNLSKFVSILPKNLFNSIMIIYFLAGSNEFQNFHFKSFYFCIMINI